MISHYAPSRGITLLVAVILSSVVLSVALALLDVAYKQQLLASTAKQSQYAFYNADSAMECALYYDQKQNAFSFSAPLTSTSITCNTQSIINYTTSVASGGGGQLRTTTFDVTCAGTDTKGSVTVVKSDGTAVCAGNKTTCIYATGYSTCNSSDPRRIERGLRVTYGAPGSSSSSSPSSGPGGGSGAEILPVSFSATSNYLGHYSGLTTANGMRDGAFTANSTTHGTNNGSNQAVTADLGSAKAVGTVKLASISTANPDGWGPAYTNGAVIEGSLDNSSYTTLATISGVVDNTLKSFTVTGTYRYIRIRQASTYLGLGDFQIFAP